MLGDDFDLEAWKLEEAPEPFAVANPGVRFAVVVIMAADGDLSGQAMPDIEDMAAGAGEEVSVLVLVDGSGRDGSAVLEVRAGEHRLLERWPEICTGDPRSLSDFFARGLVSYGDQTRFALGFWGHGQGIFGELDPDEQLLPDGVRQLELGAAIDQDVVESLPPLELPERMKFLLDLTSKPSLSRSFLPDMTSENCLTNREMSAALTAAFSRARRDQPVDMLFFDTCLASSVEVFTQVRRFCRTVVSSVLEVPGTGWDYRSWLEETARELPEDARSWAGLTVKAYQESYQRRERYTQDYQLGAWSTESDFVEAFGGLVKCLIRELGAEALVLMVKASMLCQRVVFGNNLDLGMLLAAIETQTDNQAVKEAIWQVVDRLEKAKLASARSSLCGPTDITIWCPVSGPDPEGVAGYYWWLDFNQVTRWWEFWATLSIPELLRRKAFMVSGYWGLSLVSEDLSVLSEAGLDLPQPMDRFLSLPVDEEHRELAGGLGSGVYTYEGSAGEIWLRNHEPLNELVEMLVGLDPGFGVLEGAEQRRKVLGGDCCAALARLFEQYRGEAGSSDLYAKLERLFQGAADSGVVIFHWAE